MPSRARTSLRELQARVRTESPVTFELVRHGATIKNGTPGVSVDVERGWSDVPLTEEGRQQAIEAGLMLKGRGITTIKSSNLNRAQETAEIIGEIIHVRPQFDQRLRPWKMGLLTDRNMSEVIPKLAAYARNRPDTPVPEGESFNEFLLRAFDGIAAAVNGNPGKVLLVAHTRIERLLAGWRAKGYPIEHTIDIDVFLQPGDPPGGVVEFSTHRQLLDGRISEKLTHLEAEYVVPGHGGEYCRTCRFSDHQPPPHCSWVRAIEKRGYCRLWSTEA